MKKMAIEYELSRRARGIGESEIGRILRVAAEMGDEIYRFGGGYPPNSVFDEIAAPEILAATEKALSTHHAHESLQYGKADGLTALQTIVAAKVSEQSGRTIDPRQVIVSVGLQEGIKLVAELLLDPGDVVLTDQYPYSGTLDALHSIEGVEVWGLPTDKEGIIPDSIDEAVAFAHRLRQEVKLLSTLFVGNPDTSTILTASRAIELVSKSRKHRIALFGDRAYEGLVFDNSQNVAKPFHAYDPSAIDGWTTSKAVAPGIRIGWLVVPLELVTQIKGLKTPANLCTSPLSQAIVYHYMDSGGYDANIPRINETYARRSRIMGTALEGTSSLQGNEARGGMFRWECNTHGLDTRAMAKDILTRSKVLYLPGKASHPDRWMGDATPTNPQAWLRLNFTGESEDRIPEGIVALDRVLNEIAEEMRIAN